MKKIFSISFLVLTLVAILHLAVATHYCEGKIVTSKISLTGKTLSCGMESSEKAKPLPGYFFTTHCCDDAVNYFGTDSNYAPSVSLVSTPFHIISQVFNISMDLLYRSHESLKTIYTNVSPPGVLISTDVDLSGICIFRI
jgi:hypothetical protein